jgi:hypothetical protein
MDAPATVPADFDFEQKPPDTLPADFNSEEFTPQARAVDTSMRSPDRAVPVTAADLQPKPPAAEQPYIPPMPSWYEDEEAHQMELAAPFVSGTGGYPQMIAAAKQVPGAFRPTELAPGTPVLDAPPMELAPGGGRRLMHAATEFGQGAMEASTANHSAPTFRPSPSARGIPSELCLRRTCPYLAPS